MIKLKKTYRNTVDAQMSQFPCWDLNLAAGNLKLHVGMPRDPCLFKTDGRVLNKKIFQFVKPNLRSGVC